MILRRALPIAVLLLALLAGTASAQNWIGVRTGYPLGVTVHYGIDGMFSPQTDGRISANLSVRGQRVSFGVGLDALTTVHVERPFVVYAGGGPALDFGRGGILLDIHGLVGGEFRLTDLNLDALGIFAELNLGAAIGIGRSSEIPRLGAAVGFNYRLP